MILHITLMSDSAEWSLLMMAQGGQAMLIFAWQLAESLARTHQQIWTRSRSHGICGHETISGPEVMAFVVMKPYQLPPDP
jgi:hypothetical protein